MTSYETRPCPVCDTTGQSWTAPIDARPEPTICPECKGQSVVLVYVYRKRNLRRTSTHALLWLAWNGTARERQGAEKELRRREQRR